MRKNALRRRKINWIPWAAFALAAVLAVSLVPALRAAAYARPTADDFGYSALTHDAWAGGEGLPGLLRAAAQTVGRFYREWQGTYSAVFLFSLQPGIFSMEGYGWTAFVMLTALIGGTCFLIHTALVRELKLRRSYAALLASAMLLLSVQLVPHKAQTYFWYNGSVYYTFFHGLSLAFFAVLIRAVRARSGGGRGGWTAAGAVLAAVLGGGNYSTALLCAEVLALILAVMALRKNRRAWIPGLLLGVLLAGLAVSALAPGNAVRASGNEGMSPPAAIVRSVAKALVLLGWWTELPQVLYLLLAAPVLFRAARRTGWTFRYPAAAVTLFFLLFASLMTPAYYALGRYGAGRQVALYYYCYYLFITACGFYIAGWIGNRIGGEAETGIRALFERHRFAYAMALVLLAGISLAGQEPGSMTSVQTTVSMLDGSAEAYAAQYDEMLDRIAAAEGGPCAAEGIDQPPAFLYPVEIAGDPDYWTNRQIAEYFHIESIASPAAENG